MFSDDNNLKKSSLIVIILFLAALLISFVILGFKIGKKNEGDDNLQKHKNGKSAYEIALEHGYTGSLEDFNKSLTGENGTNGKTAYEIAVETGYFSGTKEEWEEFIKGSNGKDGDDGKTLYEYALESGFTGSLDDFNLLLINIANGGIIGEDGKVGDDGIYLDSFDCINDDKQALVMYSFKLSDGSTITKIKDNFGQADEIIDIFPLHFPAGIDNDDIKMYATVENEFGAQRTYEINNTNSKIGDDSYADFSSLNTSDTHHSQKVKIELNGVSTNVEVKFFPKNMIEMKLYEKDYESDIEKYVSRIDYSGIFGRRSLTHPFVDDLNGEKLEDLEFIGYAEISSNIRVPKTLKYGRDFIVVGDNGDALKRSTYKDIEAPNGFKCVYVELCLASYIYDFENHSYVKYFDEEEGSSIISAIFYEADNNDIVIGYVINSEKIAMVYDDDLQSGHNLFENSFGTDDSNSLNITKIYIDGRTESAPLKDEYLDFITNKEDYVLSHFTEALNKEKQYINTIEFDVLEDMNIPFVCHTDFIKESCSIPYTYICNEYKENYSYDYCFSYKINDYNMNETKTLFLKMEEDGSYSSSDMKDFKCFVTLSNKTMYTHSYKIEFSFDEFISMIDKNFEKDIDSHHYQTTYFNFEKTLGDVSFEERFVIDVYVYDYLNEYFSTYTSDEYFNISKSKLESLDILYSKVYGFYLNGTHIYDLGHSNLDFEMYSLHLDSTNFDEYILNDYDFTTPGLKTLIIKNDHFADPLMIHITLIDNSDLYIKNTLVENIIINQKIGENIGDLLNYLRINASNVLQYNNYSPLKSFTGEITLNYDMFDFDIPLDESGCFTEVGTYTITINDYITNIVSEIKVEVIEKPQKRNRLYMAENVRTIPNVFSLPIIIFYDDNTCEFTYQKQVDYHIYTYKAVRTATYTKNGNILTINDDCFGILTYEIQDDELIRINQINSKDIKECYSFLENDVYVGVIIFNDNSVVVETTISNRVEVYFEFFVDSDMIPVGSHSELQKIEYQLNGNNHYIYDSSDAYNFMQLVIAKR